MMVGEGVDATFLSGFDEPFIILQIDGNRFLCQYVDAPLSAANAGCRMEPVRGRIDDSYRLRLF